MLEPDQYENGYTAAEKKYLKLIEEKDKSLEYYKKNSEDYQNDLINILEKLHKAKELLKEIKIITYSHLNRSKDIEMSNKIEEFLKQ